MYGVISGIDKRDKMTLNSQIGIKTRSDILQGQALFRGVKQLRKKMDKRQRDRQT